MSGGLLNALYPRMRRASFVLLPAGVLIGAGAIAGLKLGFLSIDEAAGVLALSFVLLICGTLLFALSWLGTIRR